jgi:acetyltransferase-like isoleucine patch superfamily enzyme
MVKIMDRIQDYILNKSDRYLHYKSENIRLKEYVSSAQQKFDHNYVILENNNLELLNRIEELSEENSILKGENSQPKWGNSALEDENCQPKRLADICTSHTRDSLENVSIGEYTYGNPKIECWAPDDKLTIGKFCSIATDVTILIGMHHCVSCASTFPFCGFMGIKPPTHEEEKIVQEETVIGNDVWIGYGALILSGVTIGDGAVIGARTVVSKDVEPYSIVAGSPLKHLRYRFPKEVRDVLLEKKWWDLPDEEIEDLVPYLIQPDVHKLLEKL